MTGKPLKITQRQVEAIAKGAVKANCRVEIKIGDVVVTLVPNSLVPNSLVPVMVSDPINPTDEELDRELEAFKRKHGYV